MLLNIESNTGQRRLLVSQFFTTFGKAQYWMIEIRICLKDVNIDIEKRIDLPTASKLDTFLQLTEANRKISLLLDLDFPAQVMGYKSKRPGSLINTINARVTVAKSFSGIQLDSLKQDTVDGYSALFQVFLSYSAFERFLKLNGFAGPYEIEEALPKYDATNVANQIRDFDKGWKFIGFLRKHTDNRRMQEALESFKRGDMDNVAVVAAAVRHIFAHGHLTAYAQGARPRVIIPVCGLLSDFLLDFMDSEFSQNIERVYAREDERGLTRRIDRKKVRESTK